MFGDPCGQHHHRRPVPDDLAVQSQLADRFDHRGGVLAVSGQQHLAAPVGDAPVGERFVELAFHRRRERVSPSADYGHRPVFEHQRIDMLGDLWELGPQLRADAAGDQHHQQTVAPSLIDRVQCLGRHLAPRCQRAIEVDGYHLKKRHRRPDPDLPSKTQQAPPTGTRWSAPAPPRNPLPRAYGGRACSLRESVAGNS